MPKIYWDTADIGDPIPPLTKAPLTRVQIAKFAAASMDWSPLHIDDEFAKSAGYGGVFAHGAISLGFAVEGIQKWMDNGRILRSTATFQKLVWPGDILTAKGVIVRKLEQNGEARVEVDVWAENQNHDIVMKGSITCLLWRNDKDEKKSKSPWPSVSSATITELKSPPPEPPAKRPKKLPPVAEVPAESSRAARPTQAPAAARPLSAGKAPAKAAPPPKVDPKAAKKAEPPKPAAKKPEKPAPKKAEKPAPKKAEKPAPKKAEKKPAKPAPKPAAKKPAKPAPKPAAKKPAKPAPKAAAKKPAKPAAKKPDAKKGKKR